MLLLYLSRGLPARGSPKEKEWLPPCLQVPTWEVGTADSEMRGEGPRTKSSQ